MSEEELQNHFIGLNKSHVQDLEEELHSNLIRNFFIQCSWKSHDDKNDRFAFVVPRQDLLEELQKDGRRFVHLQLDENGSIVSLKEYKLEI
jgi:hypothetical protein